MENTNKKKYTKVFTKISGYSTRPFRHGKEKPTFQKEHNKKTRKGTICKNIITQEGGIRWYKYIIMMYDQDGNSILAEPFKLKIQDEQLRVIQLLVKNLEERGLEPRLHWLDNGAQKNLREYLTYKRIT